MADNSTNRNNSEMTSVFQQTAFMVDLSDHYGLIRFSGDDAYTFLQGQLTCDVGEITAEQASYGSYCTPKGRVLANFLLWQYEQSYFMQLPLSLCDTIHKKLSLYKLRAKVNIENVSGDYACIGLGGVGGFQVSSILNQLFESIPTLNHSLHCYVVDQTAIIYLGADRVQLITPKKNAATILEKLQQHIQFSDLSSWDRLTIHAGIPVILRQTQEEFLPQMINLDAIGALSFKKGCYPGQEIVARTQYLGKLKRRMYLCHIAKTDWDTAASTINPGDSLYSPDMPNQACGNIVNAIQTPSGGFDVLAVIQQNSFDIDEIHYGSLQGPVLQIRTLPYSLP